jgi:hypothetical protein
MAILVSQLSESPVTFDLRVEPNWQSCLERSHSIRLAELNSKFRPEQRASNGNVDVSSALPVLPGETPDTRATFLYSFP